MHAPQPAAVGRLAPRVVPSGLIDRGQKGRRGGNTTPANDYTTSHRAPLIPAGYDGVSRTNASGRKSPGFLAMKGPPGSSPRVGSVVHGVRSAEACALRRSGLTTTGAMCATFFAIEKNATHLPSIIRTWTLLAHYEW